MQVGDKLSSGGAGANTNSEPNRRLDPNAPPDPALPARARPQSNVAKSAGLTRCLFPAVPGGNTNTVGRIGFDYVRRHLPLAAPLSLERLCRETGLQPD